MDAQIGTKNQLQLTEIDWPIDEKHANPDVNAENENKFLEAVPVRKKNSGRSESAPTFRAAIFEKFSEI